MRWSTSGFEDLLCTGWRTAVVPGEVNDNNKLEYFLRICYDEKPILAPSISIHLFINDIKKLKFCSLPEIPTLQVG